MVEPTQTEKELGMSLPKDLRNLPTEEVVAKQSLAAGQSREDTRGRSGGDRSKVRESVQKALQEKQAREQVAEEARRRQEQQRVLEQQRRQQATQRLQGIKRGLSLRQQQKELVFAGSRVLEPELKKPFKVTLGPGPLRKFSASAEEAKKNLEEGALGKIVSRKFPKTGEKISFAERSAALVFPTTRGEVAATAATGAGFTRLPSFVQTGTSFLIGASAAKKADTAITPEEKAANIAIAILSAVGGTATSLPFIKGKLAQTTGAKGPVIKPTPKETSNIKPISPKLLGREREVLTIDGVDISLAPKGKGFKFTQKEQRQQIGKEVTITTSARGLAPSRGGDVLVQPGPEGKGVFFTPTPPEIGPVARESRLGLAPNPFKPVPKGAQLGFKQEKPQIIFQENFKQKNIGFSQTSELETTIGPGAILRTERIGTSVVKGQKVEVQEIVGVKPSPTPIKTPIKQPKIIKRGSSKAPTVKINPTAGITASISRTKAPKSPAPSPNVRTTKAPRAPSPTPRPPSPPRVTGGPRPTPRISRPQRKPPIITAPPRPPRVPLVPSQPSRPGRFRTRTFTTRTKPQRDFLVEVRRGGVFRAVGRRETAAGAARLLRKEVGSTLAASGRISGGRVPTLIGFRKPKKGSRLGPGQIFVERRSFRLSKAPEIKEIQIAKKRKKKR